MDFVRVVNREESDYAIPYHGNKFIVSPGGDEIVPWEAVASLFGDPNIRNEHKNKARDKTYERVRAGLNFYNGFDTEQIWLEGGVRPSDGVVCGRKKPNVEVYTTKGERVYMLFEDPEGNHAGFNTTQLTNEQKIGQLEQMIAKQSAMLEKLLSQQTAKGEVNSLPDVTPADLNLPPIDSNTGGGLFPQPADGTKATADVGSGSVIINS